MPRSTSEYQCAICDHPEIWMRDLVRLPVIHADSYGFQTGLPNQRSQLSFLHVLISVTECGEVVNSVASCQSRMSLSFGSEPFRSD